MPPDCLGDFSHSQWSAAEIVMLSSEAKPRRARRRFIVRGARFPWGFFSVHPPLCTVTAPSDAQEIPAHFKGER